MLDATKDKVIEDKYLRLLQLTKDVFSLEPEKRTYIIGLVDGLAARKDIEKMLEGIA